ncbi:hypothetical protein D9M69_487460 [compost metagenome]
MFSKVLSLRKSATKPSRPLPWDTLFLMTMFTVCSWGSKPYPEQSLISTLSRVTLES